MTLPLSAPPNLQRWHSPCPHLTLRRTTALVGTGGHQADGSGQDTGQLNSPSSRGSAEQTGMGAGSGTGGVGGACPPPVCMDGWLDCDVVFFRLSADS